MEVEFYEFQGLHSLPQTFIYYFMPAVFLIILKARMIIVLLAHFLHSKGVLAGILRGLGMQKHGAISNFIGLDLIGLPLGSVFSFVLKWNVLGKLVHILLIINFIRLEQYLILS